jgi:hypothetical protein
LARCSGADRVEQPLAVFGQGDQHASPVVGVGVAADQPAPGELVDADADGSAGQAEFGKELALAELVGVTAAAERGEHREVPK